MSNPNRLYPLCALAMTAHLVDRLANTGLVPHDEFELLIQSTLNLTPDTPLDVYGEALIRTATTGGSIALTFTPLEGMSETVLQFTDHVQGITEELESPLNMR